LAKYGAGQGTVTVVSISRIGFPPYLIPACFHLRYPVLRIIDVTVEELIGPAGLVGHFVHLSADKVVIINYFLISDTGVVHSIRRNSAHIKFQYNIFLIKIPELGEKSKFFKKV